MKSILVACVAWLAMAGSGVAQDAEISDISDARRGTMVVLQGEVERITDTDEFRLRDASGWIEVYVGPNWVPADIGETVTVEGFVDDGIGRREVYARTLTRADGTVVTFEQRYD